MKFVWSQLFIDRNLIMHPIFLPSSDFAIVTSQKLWKFLMMTHTKNTSIEDHLKLPTFRLKNQERNRCYNQMSCNMIFLQSWLLNLNIWNAQQDSRLKFENLTISSGEIYFFIWYSCRIFISWTCLKKKQQITLIFSCKEGV